MDETAVESKSSTLGTHIVMTETPEVSVVINVDDDIDDDIIDIEQQQEQQQEQEQEQHQEQEEQQHHEQQPPPQPFQEVTLTPKQPVSQTCSAAPTEDSAALSLSDPDAIMRMSVRSNYSSSMYYKPPTKDKRKPRRLCVMLKPCCKFVLDSPVVSIVGVLLLIALAVGVFLGLA